MIFNVIMVLAAIFLVCVVIYEVLGDGGQF